MKTSKIKKDKLPEQKGHKIGSSIEYLKTVSEITNEFFATKTKNESGGNNYKDDLLKVAIGVSLCFVGDQTFNFEDFCSIASHLDLPFEARKNFFDAWVKVLEAHGRCQKIFGIYDQPVFKFL